MAPDKPFFHTMSPQQVMELLETGPEGLSASQAEERLQRYGRNRLTKGKKISALLIFLRQFANLLIVILLAATVVSYLLGDRLDAYVILAIVLACVILGFEQEYRAEKAAAALKKMGAPSAMVIREGQEKKIPARRVVPGDILILHAGDRAAADARLLEAANLKIDEALLTGESTAVTKEIEPVLEKEAPLADRRCMVFGGTVVTYGRGLAVVTTTGMETEFGRIAGMLMEVKEEPSPLERRMTVIGRALGIMCVAACAGVSLLGVVRGYPWLEMLLWGISLAVGAVPEALPAVVTGTLAIGTARMARRRAIVKRLPAVETMGCTTVICTDKTGTLTKNEMMVRRLFLDGRSVQVSGSGYLPEGEFQIDGRPVRPQDFPTLELAARISILCNDSRLEVVDGNWVVMGGPTEGALMALGRKAGLDPENLWAAFPRVGEIPFSSETKRMSTFHETPDGFLVCVKGAPEKLLDRTAKIFIAGEVRPITDDDRSNILKEASRMAAHEALRVLGLAYRQTEKAPKSSHRCAEVNLTWVGLLGLIDPPRPEAFEAIAQCHRAGIRVIMVTGDHPDTAGAIARELGLVPREQKLQEILTGADLNKLNDAQLQETLKKVSVFARVDPKHKLRLVQVLKGQGEVVAMTGDGVNDAPALKQADIGVAMGITGTEVTKQTAAMILADDNFATLVAAMEEGRAIYDNIKKYLIYSLSCNISEVLVLTGALILGMPLPLIALQILWVNLVTDGLPALALGLDPKAPDIMSRPPRSPSEGVFNVRVNTLLAVVSIYLTLILIPLFAYYYYGNPGGSEDPQQVLKRAQTMVFITLVLGKLINGFNCRSENLSLFTVGPFRNRFLVITVLLSLVMMVAVIEWDPLAALFHTTPLRWQDWLLAAALALMIVPVVEVAKWLMGREKRNRIPDQEGSGGQSGPVFTGPRLHKTGKGILINVFLIIFFLGTLELFLFITLKYPAVHSILPGTITKISRRLYFYADMNSIQYLPECARFDPDLGYTLKPGKCVFSDYEFTTEYTINSLGVRDTEEALNSPQAVVLGDSYVMGWGAAQNETFAKIIEAKTGLTVLNAGVSSYGTAREMMLLKKVPRDRLKYLIIQYCNNDYEENLSFLSNGNKLITMSREEYERLVKQNREIIKYHPGEYLWNTAKIISSNFNYLFKIGDYQKVEEKGYQLQKDETEVFIEVILNSGLDLSGVQLMVFKANSFDPRDSRFVDSLREKISAGRYPSFIKKMIIMDAGKVLNEKTDIFPLNGHYNQRGNEVIAEMIIRHMAIQ
jgi:Ca2+-transporting ATPase